MIEPKLGHIAILVQETWSKQPLWRAADER